MLKADFDGELTADFLFLLDLCRNPDDVFHAGSPEHKLAKAWIDFLCTYTCQTVAERRIKNVYLSHLCTALVEGKLYGPFVKAPGKDKLEMVDFKRTTSIAETTKSCPPGTPCHVCSPPPPHCLAHGQVAQQSTTSATPAIAAPAPTTAVVAANAGSGSTQQALAVPSAVQQAAAQQTCIAYAPVCISCPANMYTGQSSTPIAQVCTAHQCAGVQAQGQGQASPALACAMQTLQTTPAQTPSAQATPGQLYSPPQPLLSPYTAAQVCIANSPYGSAKLDNVYPSGTSTNCACTHRPCTCGGRSTGGSDQRSKTEEEITCTYLINELNFTPHFLKEFDDTLTSFMKICSQSSAIENHTVPETSKSSPQLKGGENIASSIRCPHRSEINFTDDAISHSSSQISSEEVEELSTNISDLLNAISAELRGDINPGSNEFLETELGRYKTFLSKHHVHITRHMGKLKPDSKLRNFLLLSLQNDLIKLLNENNHIKI
uniref:DUF4485 domain-containing protein n=1 Tax=Glossina morsitans morsitans TaxID=37546 RepID=A0A1B0FJR1_GLOMM